ncbi:Hypothetical predicted protein [Olea europaea subsp. europaea]|uniref:Uncharacterized protein n=1 Tax=Olea europaea subsp. europaea TaxID=158383 RepID=A0A8S0PE27_OLEEU|nr:Hypothetical predicted protein [Olea europaea subsp. europaea]
MDMGHSLEKRSSMRLQISDVVKAEALLPSADKSLQFQDKYKVQQPFGNPYIDRHCELRRGTSIEHEIQSNSSENKESSRSGSKTCKDDELVKHMSNLPEFLQQVEKEKSIQEKALNFGVLDWKRLEKWKYNEHMPTKGQTKKSPSLSSSVLMPSGTHSNMGKLPLSHGLNPDSLYKGEQFSSHSLHFNPLPHSKQPPANISHDNLSQKGEKNEGVRRYKGKSTCIEEVQAARSSRTVDGLQDNFSETVESNGGRRYMGNGEKKDSDEGRLLEKGTLPLDQGKNKVSLSLCETITSDGEKGKTGVEDDVNLADQYHPVDALNNVHLVPKHFPKGSYLGSSQFIKFRAPFDGQLTGSRTLFDGQLAEANGNRFSDSFSPQGLYSGEFSADIPHSCPLHVGVIDEDKSSMEPHNQVTFQPMNLDACTSVCPGKMAVTPIPSEAKRSKVKEKSIRHSFSDSVEDSRRTDGDIAEQPAVKGRHSSPSRRFSFSFGRRIGRSFSFKESSEASQLSSTYTATESCSVRREVLSGGTDKCDRDKSNASGRGRSSPLRRLLDPWLKYKGAHSSETVRSPDGSSQSMMQATVCGPVRDRKAETSTLQAFLQLTLKNRLPFFKLVVENSSDVLAAVIEGLPSSRKSDYSIIYAFYSGQEIRKKSVNWINQRSKSKSCSLGYNMIGQMKISSSCLRGINIKGSIRCVLRECVLYSVDPGQVDNQTQEYLLNREIAAIVVKNSIEKLNDANLSDSSRQRMKSEFTHCSSGVTYDPEDDGNSNSTVVILPSGCHGIPIKGAPSSLINRWESGGSCDCGGWDVGCKLRILTNCKKNSKILEASMPSSAIDHVKLYLQNGARESKSVFSLKPLENGFYSVKFDASISLLETFSTCVAVITCQKFSDILDMNIQPQEEHLREAMVPTRVQEQFPAKYVTCPPPSPVGRM